jgi:FtsP/CotA-like multicopper oxidase with cupredoxin domain
MRAPALTGTRALLVAALAAAGLAVPAASAVAAPVTIDLCALPGTLHPLPATAAATSIPIWGFGVPGTPGDCATATASVPGPLLSVAQGDVVTLRVTNALPAGHPLRVEISGIDFAPGPTDAAVGATVVRTFTASAPGTYSYQSAGNDGRQIAMGLAGALIVRPPTANQAYGDAASGYDVEAPIVLGAVDPAFNAAPDTYDLHAYRATYWLINGRSYPDTAPVPASAGQRVLLRYVNTGYDNTTMLMLGMHERVLARDARRLPGPVDAAAETIPAGATEDAVATVPATAPPSTRGFPLYNRQLHVTNGAAPTTSAPNPAYSPGGMLTFISP